MAGIDKRVGGIVCPDCGKVMIVGAHLEALPVSIDALAWCGCEPEAVSDEDRGRMFEIIWATSRPAP